MLRPVGLHIYIPTLLYNSPEWQHLFRHTRGALVPIDCRVIQPSILDPSPLPAEDGQNFTFLFLGCLVFYAWFSSSDMI